MNRWKRPLKQSGICEYRVSIYLLKPYIAPVIWLQIAPTVSESPPMLVAQSAA